MTRVLYSLFFTGSSMVLLFACAKSDSSSTTTVGNWIRRSDFDGVARSEAVSFVIGDTAYIGTGYDGTVRLKDFWKYDVTNNFWVQKADLPGDARSSAVGFSTNTKGYVGTGYNGIDKLKDFWEFNPQAAVSWTRKSDFAGSARYDAVGFGINDKGYITTGFDGNALKDFYEYNPANDTWTLKPGIGGTKRSGATAFVYQGKAYLCTGINNGSSATVNDFWVFDQAADQWTEKNFISNVSTETFDDAYAIVRSNAVSFVMNGKGYVSCGENGAILKDTWEYDFTTDQWTKKTDWEGLERTGAAAFSVKNRGFLLTGRNSTYRFDDMREFFPADTYNAND